MGLNCAVYLGEILRQYEVALNDGNVKNGKFFIDRTTARVRTTIIKSEQLKYDGILSEILVIKKESSASDDISIDFEKLISIMTAEDEKTVKTLKEVSSTTKREQKENAAEAKTEHVASSLKAYINTTNVDLYNAYSKWIDVLLRSNNKKYVTKGCIIEAQEVINKSTEVLINGEMKHNLEMALDILDIATNFEYTNIEWALKKYKSKTGNFQNVLNTPIKQMSADANQPWLNSSTIKV